MLAGISKPARCVGFFFSVRRYRKRWRGGHVGKKEIRGIALGFRKLKYFRRFEVWETALQGAFLLRKYHGKIIT